ncbi:hypothetical protein GALMADRAFT_1212026 [Galerina marginata CBS 339.88]|uniref:Uncharacterized protein n=1 Tax=Galerina marginata (strain CBS 339.88) TaxID=685588 RepID=A0A067SGX6_GALM3|nr:hypothetical protein GALMADRAFT_1212026 [Galerina marginata CBS 339.88]
MKRTNSLAGPPSTIEHSPQVDSQAPRRTSFFPTTVLGLFARPAPSPDFGFQQGPQVNRLASLWRIFQLFTRAGAGAGVDTAVKIANTDIEEDKDTKLERQHAQHDDANPRPAHMLRSTYHHGRTTNPHRGGPGASAFSVGSVPAIKSSSFSCSLSAPTHPLGNF